MLNQPKEEAKPLSLQHSFDADEIRKIALEEIEHCLSFKKYDPSQIESWTEQILSNLLSRISPTGETRFKYVTHCMISDKKMSGYDIFSNNYWNDYTDGLAVVDYENLHLRCCLVIWGVVG